MCRNNEIPTFGKVSRNEKSKLEERKNASRLRSFIGIVWPVQPLFLFLALPFLPSSLFLNRGYTCYFHYITIIYLLTMKEPIRRFLIVQGTGITLGWYAAMMSDYYNSGRFAHILYMNMPPSLKHAMVDQTGHVFYSSSSKMYMLLSHILDTLLHPGIVYFLYKAHSKSGGTIDNVFATNVILATFMMSRFWSILHTYINGMEVSGWYFGHDVYHIHDLEGWRPAYIAEGLFYTAIVGYKLCFHFSVKGTMIN